MSLLTFDEVFSTFTTEEHLLFALATKKFSLGPDSKFAVVPGRPECIISNPLMCILIIPEPESGNVIAYATSFPAHDRKRVSEQLYLCLTEQSPEDTIAMFELMEL